MLNEDIANERLISQRVIYSNDSLSVPRGKSSMCSSRDNWDIERDSCRSQDEEMKSIISHCGDKLQVNERSESWEMGHQSPASCCPKGPRQWFVALMDGPAIRRWQPIAPLSLTRMNGFHTLTDDSESAPLRHVTLQSKCKRGNKCQNVIALHAQIQHQIKCPFWRLWAGVLMIFNGCMKSVHLLFTFLHICNNIFTHKLVWTLYTKWHLLWYFVLESTEIHICDRFSCFNVKTSIFQCFILSSKCHAPLERDRSASDRGGLTGPVFKKTHDAALPERHQMKEHLDLPQCTAALTVTMNQPHL